MSPADRHEAPIYAKLIAERGDVPAEARLTAERTRDELQRVMNFGDVRMPRFR
ncbi:hypothetical protein [Streptomyces sp. NPDC000410]|uniref:hypothetical protein n=1 Tax=Streptomyces sp. NPDC000410 TaxID=3154254 RepID=UPI0033182186